MNIYSNYRKDELEVVISRTIEDLTLYIPLNNNTTIYNRGTTPINGFINPSNLIKFESFGKEGVVYIKYILDNFYNLPNYIMFMNGYPVKNIVPGNELLSFNEVYNTYKETKTYKFKHISKILIDLKESDLYDYTSGISSIPVEFGDPINIPNLITNIDKWTNDNSINTENINNLKHKLHKMINLSKNNIHLYEFTDLYSRDAWFMTTKEGNNFRTELSKTFNFDKLKLSLYKGYKFGYGSNFIVSREQIERYPKQFWEKIYVSLLDKHSASDCGLEKLWPFILM